MDTLTATIIIVESVALIGAAGIVSRERSALRRSNERLLNAYQRYTVVDTHLRDARKKIERLAQAEAERHAIRSAAVAKGNHTRSLNRGAKVAS